MYKTPRIWHNYCTNFFPFCKHFNDRSTVQAFKRWIFFRLFSISASAARATVTTRSQRCTSTRSSLHRRRLLQARRKHPTAVAFESSTLPRCSDGLRNRRLSNMRRLLTFRKVMSFHRTLSVTKKVRSYMSMHHRLIEFYMN